MRALQLGWIASAFVIGLTCQPAAATAVHALSYNMPNGDGTASGGAFNYWDRNYTGTGSTTTDGAALAGGLGKLTDGIISTQIWNTVSNSSGTGQYVGWLHSATPNPTITFAFAPTTFIDEVDIYLDNSGVGGVFAPSTILIDGVSEAFIPPPLGTVGKVAITGLDLTGASHTVQFDQSAGNTWTFVSEITFNTPEPGLMALLGLGVALGCVARRRR
jgi:hypothetical protein